jgi:hypothetical protein
MAATIVRRAGIPLTNHTIVVYNGTVRVAVESLARAPE